MVRSAAALVAVLILPAFLLSQEVPATHTVVEGDTLWDLAQEFYGSPWDWRRIWEANRDRIQDPNLILPGQVLTIPGVEGRSTVTRVAVEGAGVEPAAPPPAEPEAPAPPPAERERTIFYQDSSVMRSGVIRSEHVEYVPVTRDPVYSAPWLIGLEEEPEHVAVLAAFATGSDRSETPRAYNRVRLRLEPGAQVRVGDRLRIFRVTRTIPDVGKVVLPTGLLEVTDVDDDGAVAVVTREYHRIGLGDLLGPLPEYTMERGRYAQPVEDGMEAMVMGFAGGSELQDIGGMIFLDVGSADGVGVGDEFSYFNTEAGAGVVEGRVQVVGVREHTSTARIVEMADAVFRPGLVLRLTKKMP